MQKLGVALLVVLPLSFLAFSQTVPASAQSSTTTSSGQKSPQTSPPIITLGNSAVALTGITGAMLVGAIRSQAGHISPYRNGEELDLEGSLPLGITDDVDYPTQTFPLAPGDRLAFITDGVPEATNPARELFGFDRTRDISHQPAAIIMDHVLTFGQEDDITILGIQFATA